MSSTSGTEKNKGRRVAGIIFNVVLTVFMVFAFVMMIFAFASVSNKYKVATLGNKVVLNVESPSMEPTIRKGDLIIGTVLTDEEKNELKPMEVDSEGNVIYAGDIITFYVDLDGNGKKELNTHRIVEKFTSGDDFVFQTKGDNNEVKDNYSVKLDDIVCTWHEGDTQIHGIGAVFGFLHEGTGFLLVVIIPLVLLFAYEVVRLVIMVVKLRSKDKQTITDEEKEEIRRQAVEEYMRSMQGEPQTAAPAESSDATDASEQKTE